MYLLCHTQPRHEPHFLQPYHTTCTTPCPWNLYGSSDLHILKRVGNSSSYSSNMLVIVCVRHEDFHSVSHQKHPLVLNFLSCNLCNQTSLPSLISKFLFTKFLHNPIYSACSSNSLTVCMAGSPLQQSQTAPLIFTALYYISTEHKPLPPSLVVGKISHLSHRVPSRNLNNNLVLSCQSPVNLLSPTVVSTKDNQTLARQGLCPND